MDGVGRAVLARERGSRSADGEEWNLLFLGGGGYSEAHAGVRAAEHHGQPVAVGPFAKLLHAEVGLVLVIGGQQFDRLTERRAAEVGDRHFDRFDRPGAVDVGIEAGHVVDVADHDLAGVGKGGNESEARSAAETGNSDLRIFFPPPAKRHARHKPRGLPAN